jgi:cell wall-associated NlpC family hydrolase
VRSFSAFLHAAPRGRRDRELICGDRFDVLEESGGWAFGEATKDGYTGYVAAEALGEDFAPTHLVACRQSHLYPEPDLKTPPTARLPFGAAVAVLGARGRWSRTAGGWVWTRHLRPVGDHREDPVAVAELFLGTPYLWAGNTGDGIDCSGLVQAACLACGIACPGDSDQQEAALGQPLPAEAEMRRGDLLFWKGHVAWAAGPDRILHANAHAMAVSFEDASGAIARIEAQGDGAVTSRRRFEA